MFILAGPPVLWSKLESGRVFEGYVAHAASTTSDIKNAGCKELGSSLRSEGRYFLLILISTYSGVNAHTSNSI